MLLVDTGLKITYANHAAQSLLEQSLNQLQEAYILQFLMHPNLDSTRFRQTIQGGEIFSVSEVQVILADGRHLLADITATGFEPKERGTQRSLLLEIRQVDQQKRISQESQQWAQQQAARDLVRGLAHEIKNPLGGIRGAAQLLEKELPAQELHEFTKVIIEQSDRLRNLVDRLLGPNSPPNFQLHNVHKVLEKIRTLVSLDLSHNITIIRDYDPSIPDMRLDQDMIQQAVLNIVRNSVQALTALNQQEGVIQIITRIERQMTIHGRRYPLCAQIKIVDNGPGIPEQIRDTLFYPMVTSKQGGTGLGLSIAQTLIDHHGGKIEVDSWPGHTEFTLYLPIDKKDKHS